MERIPLGVTLEPCSRATVKIYQNTLWPRHRDGEWNPRPCVVNGGAKWKTLCTGSLVWTSPAISVLNARNGGRLSRLYSLGSVSLLEQGDCACKR